MKAWVAAAAALGLAGAVGAQTALRSEPYVWRNVEIVGGGFVTGIIFSPAQRNLVYARTDIGGAYRWNPDTGRWIPLEDWLSAADWNLYGVESLATDPTDPNRLYLAVGTYTNSWAGNGAVLRSSDQGRTWQRTDMPFKMGGNEDGRSIGERLAVDPSKPSLLYMGTRNVGLWRSPDAGATWGKVDSFPITGRTNGIGIGFVLFDTRGAAKGSPTPTLYVGAAVPGDNLYRSTDGGATWAAVPGQPRGMLPHHGVLTSGGTLYLTYGSGPGPNGMADGAVWKLDTQSGAWTDITPIKPNAGGEGGFGYAGLTVDASRPGTVMVSTMDRWSKGDDILRSTDGGATWSSLQAHSERDSAVSPYLNWGRPNVALGHWIGDVEIDPFMPGHVLYVTGATIWGSDDANALDAGGTSHWTPRAQGLEETAVNELISPPVGAHLLSAMGDLGGFRHDDLTISPRQGMMTNPLITSGSGIDFAERKPEIMARVGSAAPGQRGGYSLDGGATWSPFRTEPASREGSGSIAASADGGVLVWAPQGAAPFWSTDRGATWTASTGCPAGARVLADRSKAGRFYGFDANGRRLYVSQDGGKTFTQAAALPENSDRIRAVPGREGDLWLGAKASGLFHSTDGGKTFVKVAGAEEGEAVGFGKAAPGKRYPAVFMTGTVGGVHGVFRSDDAGNTWVRINDDQHQYGWIGQNVTGDPRVFGRVYMATNGRGILYADPAREAAK